MLAYVFTIFLMINVLVMFWQYLCREWPRTATTIFRIVLFIRTILKFTYVIVIWLVNMIDAPVNRVDDVNVPAVSASCGTLADDDPRKTEIPDFNKTPDMTTTPELTNTATTVLIAVKDLEVPKFAETSGASTDGDQNHSVGRTTTCTTVNPSSITVLTGQKCLTTNAKRTTYNRMEAQKYAGDVKEFCGDDTETTIPELNRIKKYWIQRHLLFVRFDAGILLDHESFYSVCPEVLAKHIADRCRFPDGVAVDPFCGAGGNIIQLAKTCRKVIAMDIDGKKLEMARHNAGVYAVAGNIEFRQNDFFSGPSGQTANVVVTSPPWGGPEYLRQDSYSPSVMCEAYGGGEAIVRIARTMAPKLALHLPRTVDKSECVAIAKKLSFTRIKFEDNFINGRLNSTTVFLSY